MLPYSVLTASLVVLHVQWAGRAEHSKSRVEVGAEGGAGGAGGLSEAEGTG